MTERPPDRAGGGGRIERVLVVKLSALGDFVLALGPFKAIRLHHGEARITLLTTAPFADLARRCGYFDEVWIDSRPKPYQVPDWLALARRLRGGRFDRVYDLQRTDRSNAYYQILRWRRPLEWCGIARGCSHAYTDPDQHRIHTIERQKAQLRVAGIEDVPDADLSWITADLEDLSLPERFALLVAGSAAHRPEKRWPAARFAELAARLASQGTGVVLLGTAAERETLDEIVSACPGALDLGGRTGLEAIVALARRASLAVGNDTGPMHLIAAAGCPSIVLFSGASDPALTAPRGPLVAHLRKPALDELNADEVVAAIEELGPRP